MPPALAPAKTTKDDLLGFFCGQLVAVGYITRHEKANDFHQHPARKGHHHYPLYPFMVNPLKAYKHDFYMFTMSLPNPKRRYKQLLSNQKEPQKDTSGESGEGQ